LEGEKEAQAANDLEIGKHDLEEGHQLVELFKPICGSSL
jgi:hypothetical protein